VPFDRSDDLVLALQIASGLFSSGRYDLIASVDGDEAAALRVTEVANVFKAWLRQPVSITLTLVSVEEQEPVQEAP